MAFTIIAERQGILLFNRCESAAEALIFAAARCQGGAETVNVFDEAGAFIGASRLAEAARQQADITADAHRAIDEAAAIAVKVTEHAASADAKTIRVSDASEQPRDPVRPPRAKRERTRIFRARRPKA